MPMTRKGRILVPATVPFWLKPASTFGLLSMTMFIERSPGFAIPSILAPLRLDADRDIVPSRFRRQSADCGSIVRRRCTRRYLPAHLRRIPLMGQRVVSWHNTKAISQKEFPYSGGWCWVDQNVVLGQCRMALQSFFNHLHRRLPERNAILVDFVAELDDRMQHLPVICLAQLTKGKASISVRPFR